MVFDFITVGRFLLLVLSPPSPILIQTNRKQLNDHTEIITTLSTKKQNDYNNNKKHITHAKNLMYTKLLNRAEHMKTLATTLQVKTDQQQTQTTIAINVYLCVFAHVFVHVHMYVQCVCVLTYMCVRACTLLHSIIC